MNLMLLIWVAMIDGQYMSTAVVMKNNTACQRERTELVQTFTNMQVRHHVTCKQIKLQDAM